MPHLYPFICWWKFTFLPPLTSVNAVMNSAVQISLRCCFEFFWSRIVASDVMLFLMFLRSAVWKNIFHNGCPILYSYLHYARVPTSLYLCQHLIFSVLLIMALLKGMRWLAYICGFELHFSCDQWCWPSFHLLFGYLYILGELLLQVFCQFLNWVIFSLLSCMISLHTWDISPLSDMWFAKFSLSLWPLF